MAKVRAEFAPDVCPLLQGVHLMNANTVEVVMMALKCVEYRHWFTVGQRHDEVRASLDVAQNVLRVPDVQGWGR